jgi:hypothetical protein
LSLVIGKDPAKKVMERGTGKLEGEDLNIGGVFHRMLYDKKLPEAMEKLAKKLGGVFEYTTLTKADGSKVRVPKLRFTDEFKKNIKEKGTELFQATGAIGAGALLKNYVDEQRQQNTGL